MNASNTKKSIFVLIVLAVISVPGLLFAANASFTIVALPDTQSYSRNYPAIFTAQTQWIKDNKSTKNIAFVTHLGDLVDSARSGLQWSNAITSMNILDGVVAHGVVRGNHDYWERTGYYLNSFGPNSPRNLGQSWYGGASPTGYSSYQKINAGGRDFIMLGLDIITTTAEVSWAQSVIDDNPGVPTILTTHNYLAETGGGGSYGSGTGERGRVPVRDYGSDYSPEEMFQALVYPNDEIFMVLCGHNFAQYNLVATNAAGNDVHEILIDYQTLPYGGNGFLRMMEFDLDNNVIHSTTYSPTLDRDMVAADTSMLLDLNDPNGHAFDIYVDFDARYGSVPEPATMGLLVVGGAFMAMRRRRRKA